MVGPTTSNTYCNTFFLYKSTTGNKYCIHGLTQGKNHPKHSFLNCVETNMHQHQLKCKAYRTFKITKQRNKKYLHENNQLKLYLEAPLTVLSKFLVARRKIERKAKFPNKTSISIYNWSQETYLIRHIIKSKVIMIHSNPKQTYKPLKISKIKKKSSWINPIPLHSLLKPVSCLRWIRLCLYTFWNEFKEQ